MREQRHPRQIATVVSVDAVGFSKLMHIDEEEALRLFDERRAVIVEAVERAGGNTFGAAGDSIMALFGNPIVALQAVLQFQAAIAEINSAVARDRVMPFRTGISAGQVIIRDDGVFGDTVNIAARVQEFSPHGGIALTETAYLQLQQQFQLPFTDLGPFQLKNIPFPCGCSSPARARVVSPRWWKGAVRPVRLPCKENMPGTGRAAFQEPHRRSAS